MTCSRFCAARESKRVPGSRANGLIVAERLNRKKGQPVSECPLSDIAPFRRPIAVPFIMISRSRKAERDRHQADEDYRTNVEAERRIEDLQKRLAEIEVNKLNRIIEMRSLSRGRIRPARTDRRSGARY